MNAPLFSSAKPYTRWWWFSGPINPADIRTQLDWVKANNFGGVEIAWLYPLNNGPLGAAWLSPEWAESVMAAAEYAAKLGLGCDFTMGSAWPYGGFHVTPEDASQLFSGPSPQRLEKSWETPMGDDGGPILNHLDRNALMRYGHKFGAALQLPERAAGLTTPGFFCDSWEVLSEGLWTAGFDAAFQARFGYDITPFMPTLNEHPDERYDYRRLLAAYALDEFYAPYTALCHELGGFSRVQCHGSPTDLVAAYALVDVPETEAILFDVDFASFAAAAAALTGKPIVSVEAFTCMYGWNAYPGPGPYQKQEVLADLKLVADGLMANGVNQFFWHGMPYNPPGGDQRFYATTHVGPDSAFAPQIPEFNMYMESICNSMRQGKPYTDVAVYLPLEDVRVEDELPLDLQKVSSKYVYELQETKLPRILKGHQPVWVSTPFLEGAQFTDGQLQVGPAVFNWLYVDSIWLDLDSVSTLLRLARQGLPICMVRSPQEPGHNKHSAYEQEVAELIKLPNVVSDWSKCVKQPALVAGDNLPDFWCTVNGDEHSLFFANPASQALRYPIRYGQALETTACERPIKLNIGSQSFELTLKFAPQQSVLLQVSAAGVKQMPVDFDPIPTGSI
ncbi:MAG: glycosyl hydrolase [Chloroflexota bacterium]